MTTTASSNPLKDIERIFALQKKNQWKMKNTTAAERIELLEKMKGALENHREELDEALYQDLGRPKTSSEINGVLKKIKNAADRLEEWMKPVVHSHPHIQSASYYVQYEPRGVVLLFGAWNVPVDLIFSPLIAILAAGNTAIAKPSELTPKTSALIASIIRSTFNEDTVAVVEGDANLAIELQKLPFDHIFVTGSPNVGRMVMGAAAKHLTSVTLELGGRNPLILDETADFKALAQGIGIGKTYNSGQICLAVNHVFAPKSKVDELVQALSGFYTSLYYENGVYQASKVGRIVDARNFDRIVGDLEGTIKLGAKVAFGGACDRDALTIEPTVLTDVPADSPLVRNEIFAPITPIIAYEDIQDAIDHINSGGKPLGMYVFSKNQSFIDRILGHTSCGGVTINGWALHGGEDDLPFGGVGESGMGSYHGIHGFLELSHAKPVFKTF
jgi:NAD-dependent aldehyde dehydrogenases